MATKRKPYTPGQIKKLRRLNALARKTNGSTLKGAPEREAAIAFAAEVARVRDSVDPRYNYPELAEPLGINHRTLRQNLARHGHEILSPSLARKRKKYADVTVTKRTSTTFACGHPRTEGNTYWENTDPPVDRCRTCQLKRVHKRHQGKGTE